MKIFYYKKYKLFLYNLYLYYMNIFLFKIINKSPKIYPSDTLHTNNKIYDKIYNKIYNKNEKSIRITDKTPRIYK